MEEAIYNHSVSKAGVKFVNSNNKKEREAMSLKEIHERVEKARDLVKFLAYLELTEIPECRFYRWDNAACEEYCSHPLIRREKDFDSKQECWKCDFRKRRVREKL